MLVGCNGFFTSGSTTPGTTGFVYVLNQNTGGIGSISAYLADAATGDLTPLLNSPTGAGSTPNSIAADRLGRFVYASNQGGGINGFLVSQNTNTLGQLTSTGAATPTKANPVAIAVDPSARAVYAVEPGPQVEVFAITLATGVLTAPASPASLSPPAAIGISPTSVTVAASGTFLFVGMADGSILSLPINADGTLKTAAIVSTPPLSGIQTVSSLTATPTVRFLYAVDGTTQSLQNLSAYAIDSSTGALTAVSATPFQAGLGPVGVAVDARSLFVFTANEGSNNVSAFTIGGNGTLGVVLNSPFGVSATTPVAVAVDPSGNFLYVANKGSNTVSSFVILGNGVLTPSLAPSAITGTAPVAVVAVP